MRNRAIITVAALVMMSCEQPTSAAGAVGEPSAVPPANTGEEPSMEVRGISISMQRYFVPETAAERGLIVLPEDLPPIVSEALYPMAEGGFRLPEHVRADTIYADTLECRQSLQRRREMTPEQHDSLAGATIGGCNLAARIFYDPEDIVVAFYFTPHGFGLGNLTVQEFAQVVVDNLGIYEMNSHGEDYACTTFRGDGPAGERLSVSDCNILRFQVERSPAADADFR